jgi:hypothetical protein
MRIFISSVRTGLEQERDALPGLVRALGHEPVRFEEFTAQAVPSREACINGVESSDAYLLLLGPNYGEPLADTGHSPTHDEWIAATRIGIPRFVFRKNGPIADERQREFETVLGDYRSGRFWANFEDTLELLAAVVTVVRELEAGPSSLTFEPLPHPISIDWYAVGDRSSGSQNGARPQLEIHVAQLGGRLLSERILDQVESGIPSLVRAAALADQSAPLDVDHSPGLVTLVTSAPQRGSWQETSDGHLSGVHVAASGQVSVLFGLPGDAMGTIYDPQDVSARIASALRLIGQIGVVRTPLIAIGVGLTSMSMVAIGTAGGPGRNRAGMTMSSSAVRAEPDEAISIAALDQGAGEVAVTLSRTLLRAVQRVR